MGKQQDREKIVQEIKVAADLYRKHLVGKRFLYVFEGRYIEVLYKAANFRHLTGVATNLSAKKFYSYAAKKCFRLRRYFLHRSTLFHCVSVRLSISDRLQCWLAQKDLCWKRLSQTRELISLAQQILILLYA